MDNNHILINLEDIHFSYPGGRPALKGISFQLRDREKVGLTGANGSGKTTLFHVIMGLLKPTSGKIEIFGKRMGSEGDFRAMRQKIGLLFQDPDDQLFSPTALEDVAFGPLNQGKSISEAKKIARETLSQLGLSEFEDRVTYKLSGGEKRLVSLATVLAMKPKVLLLDEPTTGLDFETTEMMIHTLKRLDLAYVSISHDMDFITQTTDKSYGLINGQIPVEEEMIPHAHTHVHGFGRFPHSHSHVKDIRLNREKHYSCWLKTVAAR
jgi:cobalt/nickel transport system ATP-binding protein